MLEPYGHPAVKPFKAASSPTASRTPRSRSTTSQAEYERLERTRGEVHAAADQMGPVTTAVFDDTCGNLIQIVALPAA